MSTAHDPLFIIGHWRSGTTHLHNLLSLDSQFGTVTFRHTALPWDFMNQIKIGRRLLERYLPEDRGMDGVKLSIDSPQEEEMALGNMGLVCFYFTYYFPRRIKELFRKYVLFEGLDEMELSEFEKNYRYLIEKLCLENGGKRLLLKNPSNTARMLWLKKVFPQAQFIHIYRNPRAVYRSTVKHFDKIMPEFALQNYHSIDFEEVTLEHYQLLMDRFIRDKESLPPGDLYELSFEALEADPFGEIEKLYEALSITGFESQRKMMKGYFDSLGSYKKNSYEEEPVYREQVEDVLRRYADLLGYSRIEEPSLEK